MLCLRYDISKMKVAGERWICEEKKEKREDPPITGWYQPWCKNYQES